MLMYIWIRSQRFLVFIAALVAAEVALAHTPRVNDKADLVGKSFSAKDTLRPFKDPKQDARRARDAVVGLPKVDGECIGLQGTSLGGFIGATSAALDDVYDHVFLMLAGGQLYEVLQTGQRDAAQIRTRLAEAGLSGEVLRKGLFNFEPTRLAHRLSAQKTWLFSGKFDTVVKLRYAQALSEKIGLEEEHHVIMACDHYSGILQLPQLIFRMRETLAGQPFEIQE